MYCMDNMDHLHQLVILCICLACIYAHFRTHVPRHTSTYMWKVPDVPIFETESGVAHMSMHMSVHKSMHMSAHKSIHMSTHMSQVLGVWKFGYEEGHVLAEA